jgi:hypothetical protein
MIDKAPEMVICRKDLRSQLVEKVEDEYGNPLPEDETLLFKEFSPLVILALGPVDAADYEICQEYSQIEFNKPVRIVRYKKVREYVC